MFQNFLPAVAFEMHEEQAAVSAGWERVCPATVRRRRDSAGAGVRWSGLSPTLTLGKFLNFIDLQSGFDTTYVTG